MKISLMLHRLFWLSVEFEASYYWLVRMSACVCVYNYMYGYVWICICKGTKICLGTIVWISSRLSLIHSLQISQNALDERDPPLP